MVAGGDLARVAEGAGKVAKALFQLEGPVMARQALRFKEHGKGLASSLKNAVSLAVSSQQHQQSRAPSSSPQLNGPGTKPHHGGGGAASAALAVGATSIEQQDYPPPSAGLREAGLTGAATQTGKEQTPGIATSPAWNAPHLRTAAARSSETVGVESGATFSAHDVGNHNATLPSSRSMFSPKLAEVAEKRADGETFAGFAQAAAADSGDATATANVVNITASEEDATRAAPQAGAAATPPPLSNAFGTSPGTEKKERGKKVDKSGPWAFAAPSESELVMNAANAAGGEAGKPRSGGGMSLSRTRTVPSSPLARVFGFGQLAAGLAMGTVAEAVRQSVRGGYATGGPQGGGGNPGEGQGGRSVKQYVASDANAERLAETLCRMRGAALKLGQMLSIQDESIIPPSLAKALDRVRQGADMMPTKQLHRQLEKSLGADWRSKVASFDEVPIAAASIGQVHRARLHDGTEVAMKIQYPGVADSVESDLKNLQRLVQLTNILPPGLYIDEIIKVARDELSDECDYEREAVSQERFRKLVESDESLSRWASVPKVVHELVSKEVLTTHLAPGVPVDQVLPMPQDVRNHVARLMLRCTINELFDWRFMQTDPNWGNFLFDRETGKMSLIDFGACREYRKDFVDDYLRLVWAAANRDEAEIMRVSQELKFLTGDETATMMQAHLQAGLVVGEPFIDRGDEGFDFHGSNITARLSQHGDTFMKHRLTPPPQEAYSLHRKLAGAFLMNIKLKAKIPCRDILEEVYERYTFG